MEFLIRFALVIGGIVLFAFLLKFKLFRVAIVILRKFLIFLLFFVFSGALIALFSLIVGALIILSIFISDTFVLLNGESITLVEMNSIFAISIIFGALFYCFYIGGTIFYSFIRLEKIVYLLLVYGTAIVAQTLLYPIVLQAIMSDVSISFTATIYLNVSIVIFLVSEMIRSRIKELKHTRVYRGGIRNVKTEERRRNAQLMRHIFPWIHNRKTPQTG